VRRNSHHAAGLGFGRYIAAPKAHWPAATNPCVTQDFSESTFSAGWKTARLRDYLRWALAAGDGGNRGSGGEADGEPFCGALESDEESSAMGHGDGGVSFVLEGRGAGFFIGQIFFQGVCLHGGGAAVLEIVVERDEIRFGDGDGGGGGFSGGERGGEIWIMDGDGEREDG
jgi:hypothetical protein